MWWRRHQTTKEKGDSLERRIEKLYRKLGKLNVKRNITLKDFNGNTSQIDVRYGLFWRKYIECKNYNHPVPLEMVAKFKEVLRLNGISPSRGIFITTNTFTPRATTIGIRCIDGKQLRRIERAAPVILLCKLCATVFCIYAGVQVYRDYEQQQSNQRSRSLSLEIYWKRYVTVQRLPTILNIPSSWMTQLREWKQKLEDNLPKK